MNEAQKQLRIARYNQLTQCREVSIVSPVDGHRYIYLIQSNRYGASIPLCGLHKLIRILDQQTHVLQLNRMLMINIPMPVMKAQLHPWLDSSRGTLQCIRAIPEYI